MRPYKSLAQKPNMINKAFQRHDKYLPKGKYMFARDHLEPISTQEAAKRTISILDADYDKANLLEIVKDT